MASLLVVDDDPHVCELLRRLLSRAGHAVTCAGSGSDGLAVLREQTPDLMILDWMMPEVDGAEVLRRLRADPETKAVRVMVYTAADEPDVEREAKRLGALDCVPKVGRFHDLRERIECCLRFPRDARGGDARDDARGGNGRSARTS